MCLSVKTIYLIKHGKLQEFFHWRVEEIVIFYQDKVDILNLNKIYYSIFLHTIYNIYLN